MIVVTGAAGKLGRLVIASLLETTPAQEIVAAVRNPAKAEDLTRLGVQVREADYSKPETLHSAIAGADRVLLISGSEVGHRISQHQAVIDAARSAGTALLAYTSILRADTSALALSVEHKATEQNIRESGLTYAFLRNGWYFENQTGQLGTVLQHGAILGAAGDGRFAFASRADYAAAAASVLTAAPDGGGIYELAGDTSCTLSELAAEVSRQSGKSIVYNNLAPDDYKNALLGFGLPSNIADLLVDSQIGAKNGELDSTSSDLRSLIQRPTTTLTEAVAAALKTL